MRRWGGRAAAALAVALLTCLSTTARPPASGWWPATAQRAAGVRTAGATRCTSTAGPCSRSCGTPDTETPGHQGLDGPRPGDHDDAAKTTAGMTVTESVRDRTPPDDPFRVVKNASGDADECARAAEQVGTAGHSVIPDGAQRPAPSALGVNARHWVSGDTSHARIDPSSDRWASKAYPTCPPAEGERRTGRCRAEGRSGARARRPALKSWCRIPSRRASNAARVGLCRRPYCRPSMRPIPP